MVLGLIVNELVTNALKHAFPHGSGSIRVSFDVEGDQGVLAVANDGCGVAAASPRPGGGLGSRLLAALSDQLAGTLTRDAAHQPGTRHVVRFPLDRRQPL